MRDAMGVLADRHVTAVDDLTAVDLTGGETGP
jgi:hypothetical protein